MLTKTTVLKQNGNIALNQVEQDGKMFYSVTELISKGEGRGAYTVTQTHKETKYIDIAESRFETQLLIKEYQESEKFNALVRVLDYCKMIDRNGSWDEIYNDIKEGNSTLKIELENLSDTLATWVIEEETGSIDSTETRLHLKAVNIMLGECK